MKKVLFYLASNSPFYTNLYPSIKRGFEEAGCLVEGSFTLLPDDELIEKVKTFKPDFVFEMNRTKSEIRGFPQDVIHICWLVDFWGRMSEELIGSDILYVWSHSWIKKFKELGIEKVFYLPPATDCTVYTNLKDKKVDSPLFIGHISKPWTDKELNRPLMNLDGKKYFFQDILPYAKEYILSANLPKPFYDTLVEYGFMLDKNVDKALIYDIFSRSFRQIRREDFIDKFREIDSNINIYGSQNWLLYNKYKKLYKGYIENPYILGQKIQSSQVLLHDHFDPHFRTFDAMACATPVVIAKEKNGMISPWTLINLYDSEDYISMDIYSKTLSINYLDKKRLKEIGQNAQEKVLKNHLWVHRIEKVLKDFSQLKNKPREKDE